MPTKLKAFKVNDFSGGLVAIGSGRGEQVSDMVPEDRGYFMNYHGFGWIGPPDNRSLAVPQVGDTEYNNPYLNGPDSKIADPATDAVFINGLFPYVKPSEHGGVIYRAVTFDNRTTGLEGTMFLVSELGSHDPITGLPETDGIRTAVQIGDYLYIATKQPTGSDPDDIARVCRFTSSALWGTVPIGAQGIDTDKQVRLGFAGTPCPEGYNPSDHCSDGGGGGMETNFGYKYRVAIEYGEEGSLGMGFVESAAEFFCSGGIELELHDGSGEMFAPVGWSHARYLSVFRNTKATPGTFYRRVRYEWGSAPDFLDDSMSDSTLMSTSPIYTDPVSAQGTVDVDGEDCPFSSLLPPCGEIVALYKGRLWVGRIKRMEEVFGGTTYPRYHYNSVAHSRVGRGPSQRPDQFEPADEVIVGRVIDSGTLTCLVEFQNNLYAWCETEILGLAQEPGEGRLPFFASIVSGAGATSYRSVAVTKYGVVSWYGGGLILFDGSTSPKPLSQRIEGAVVAASVVGVDENIVDHKNVVGGWNPETSEYMMSISRINSEGDTILTRLLAYSPSRDSWRECSDIAMVGVGASNNSVWSYAAVFGRELNYVLVSGENNGSSGKNSQYIWRASLRPEYDSDYGESLSDEAQYRKLTTKFYDFGESRTMKSMRYVDIELTEDPGFDKGSFIEPMVRLFKDGLSVVDFGYVEWNWDSATGRVRRYHVPSAWGGGYSFSLEIEGQIEGDAIIKEMVFWYVDDGRDVESSNSLGEVIES